MMDGQSEVAVSLDELTLDIALDVSNEFSQEDCLSLALKKDVMSPGDQSENMNIFSSDALQDLSAENKDLDDEKMIVAEGNINIEVTNRNQLESSGGLQTETISAHDREIETVKAIYENTDTSDTDDFEADIHPLTLFPRKNDDEEDSEFEFPDPADTNNGQNNSSNSPPTDVGNKTVHFTEIKKEIVNEDTRIDSNRQDNLDPEIFTPRSKVNSDITTILHEVKKQTDEYMTDGGIDLIKTTPNEATEMSVKEYPQDNSDEDTERSKPSIVTTAEDWEQVQVVVPGFADQNKSKTGAAPVIESKPLAKFTDSWSEMASMNYDGVKEQIKTRKDRRGISAFTHFFFGPPKLHKELLPDRDLIFCLAATKFDNDCQIHNQVLQTVYRCLTGSKFDCQRYGSHWEEIGFQGQDPATDLRGGGILSLLHILYFLQEPKTKELARDIYKLSLHPTQNFPFCVMSINISVMCLRAVREDIYNKEFNRRKDIVGTINSLYTALFLQMYQLWKKGKTIHDSGYVLEEVTIYSRKNSKNIFKDLESYEKSKKENLFGDHPSDNATFFNVCKEEKCDDKTTAELY